jgi:hypothetical protein
MTPDELLNPRRWWYGIREETLITGLIALDDMWGALSYLQRRDMLDLVLPGVTDAFGAWDELHEPLTQLARLDGVLAVSILQDRGEFSGLTMDRQAAYDRVRGEYVAEVQDVIRRHLRPLVTVDQAALVAVAP